MGGQDNVRATRRQVLQGGAAAIAMGSFASCAKAPIADDEMELASIDAVETVRRLREGEITIVEVVSAAIDRAKSVNPFTNAIVTNSFDDARRAAAAGRTGAFAGLPTFIKDLTDVKGQPTQYGARAFAGNIAASQPPFTDAMDQLGVISLGKSATPEFGLTATTEPLAHGPTRNPWNVDHSVGGSSGGAAALVASGVVPMAHASDGGGSIRIPASSCGLVGLKPTRARLPSPWLRPAPPIEISTPGVVSRTVRDTIAFYAAMEAVAPPSLPLIGGDLQPVERRLKIGFFTDGPTGYPVDPDVVEAVTAAAAICEAAGHTVEAIATPFDASPVDDFMLYWAGQARQAVSGWEKATGRRAGYDEFEPFTFGLVRHFETNRSGFDKAVRRLKTFEAMYEKKLGDFDVFLSPVLSTPPPRIGHLRTDVAFDVAFERVMAYAQFTGGHNLSGAPAISLPLGQSTDGLPIGAMFAAKKGQDKLLLELSLELEEAAPWIARRAPLFGKGPENSSAK